MEEIKVFETFSGYGGASFALKKVGIPFKVVGYSEVDKFAIQCYEQNHWKIPKCAVPEGFNKIIPKNFGDITKIDPSSIPNFDLLTGGFPCQDVSIAGKGDLSNGRTILFDEIIRIADVKQPRWMLLENVKGLLSKKHREFYEHTLSELNRIGYEVFMVYSKLHKENRLPVLNSKNFGIPQNRERVFYICFRDSEDLNNFKLPESEELLISLKDLLEDNVDEKYYLSDLAIDRILGRSSSGKLDDLNGVCKTITASNNYKGGRQANIIQVNPNGKYIEKRVYNIKGVSPTMSCTTSKDTKVLLDNNIRKLTPIECFRLMGFLNDEINLDNLSDTQRYKLAGNGWDINLVSKIFQEMFK